MIPWDMTANKFLLIVNGTEQEIERAKGILIENKADEANVHTGVLMSPPKSITY
jgi:hypothetical protein